MSRTSAVRVWEENVTIPTYETARPDRNPLFLEKRVYQGSSGKVYPHPVTDTLSDTKTDKVYRALFLENEYLKVMILPELGGRIQRAFDKTRSYDFVYYNHVIKPALVGLAGPWVSGGIEFNWPQHHRPSTFDEVNAAYRENPDGSATIVVSEYENMFHTKGETEFTLYPDKAWIELKNHLYNRTPMPQTFLWWANPAVSVNSNYRSIFPPDVTAVMDHGKRDVSTFPIATGTYYKVDYSRGVDISRYENLPVPTSYMAAKSDFDFVGGYDEGVRAGLLHVADHHISPGKKQWTWGSGDFGKAWDRNLTDGDGPYFELMTGCFTDNQPDFSYIAPFESRDFTQYFMPYHDLGQVHNACRDLSLHLDVGAQIRVLLYCSGTLGNCDVLINGIQSKMLDLQCAQTYEVLLPNDAGYSFEDVKISIVRNGREILSFDGNVKKQEIPSPAAAAPLPEECKTTEDLYLYGTHIEQYRHATRRAEDYYLEGLRRDPTDMRLNDAYGLLLFRKGQFEASESCFRKAVEKQMRSNPNGNTGRYCYDLGISLFYQGKLQEAYDAFYKAVWNADTKAEAWYHLALIESNRGNRENAVAFADQALASNARLYSAMNLKALLTGEKSEAAGFDDLNLLALYLNGEDISGHVVNPNMLIDLALEAATAGFTGRALDLLSLAKNDFPLIWYYRAFWSGDRNCLERAAEADPYCCFPNRIEDIKVLEYAIRNNPDDSRAPYYLGCLYYDRERHDEAAACFRESIERGADFATPYRNFALLAYNISRDGSSALELMERAFSLDRSDARILYELDLLKKRLGISPDERLAFLSDYPELVDRRDDLSLEFITLLNLTGRHAEAMDRLTARRFHPWEGGEGKVPEQYVFSCIALDRPEDAFTYPENLGEGKLFGAQENRQNYAMGVKTGDASYFEKASKGISEPSSVMYYNDQPPETIFWQGMALRKLGRNAEADDRFSSLIRYADQHMEDTVTIDYFAVSLPDLLVFEEDLNVKNRIHCLFMKALGLYGIDSTNESRALFDEALMINPNTFQVATHRRMLFPR